MEAGERKKKGRKKERLRGKITSAKMQREENEEPKTKKNQSYQSCCRGFSKQRIL
jgi:hypothetical protein